MLYGPQRRSQWIPENGCDFCECFALVLFIYFFPISGPVYLYLKLRQNKCCFGYRVKHCHPCCHCGCDCSCDYCCCCQKEGITYRSNESRIINVEPRRFYIETTFHNNGTIISRGVIPRALRQTDQIGQRNDLGLPIYFPDPITEQRVINIEEFPNEPVDDIPTFEQAMQMEIVSIGVRPKELKPQYSSKSDDLPPTYDSYELNAVPLPGNFSVPSGTRL